MTLLLTCPQTFAVFEGSSDWGETLCAASPNPTTVVTAGTSAVVCVWDVVVDKDQLTCMKLREVSLQVNNNPACVCEPHKCANLGGGFRSRYTATQIR